MRYFISGSLYKYSILASENWARMAGMAFMNMLFTSAEEIWHMRRLAEFIDDTSILLRMPDGLLLRGDG